MRVLKYVCLGVMLLCAAPLRAQDTLNHLSIGLDAGRLCGDFLISNSLHLESVFRYQVHQRYNLRLGIGYGEGFRKDTVYSNISDYRSQGIFLKPGIEISTPGQDFSVGLDVGISFVHETGTYRIAGPYWGDYVGKYDQRERTYYSDFFFAYNFFTKGPVSYSLGANMSFYWPPVVTEMKHLPMYVPGFGNLHMYWGFHLLGTIYYHV